MALGIILGVGLSGFLKGLSRTMNETSLITWELLKLNVLFYGFLFVGILFFWNWFNGFNPAYCFGRRSYDLIGLDHR